MKTLRTLGKRLLFGLVIGCTSSAPAPDASREGSIAGWFLSGPNMGAFKVDVDREVRFRGAASGRLTAVERGVGAGTLMQSIAADAYRGKRLRFAAVVKTRDVEGWTGLWMRIDRPNGRVTFDNMQSRPLRGSNEWTNASVVLDVAPDATAIHFGLLQDGAGTSWLDECALEVVGNEVAVTSVDPYPRALVNADLESAEASITGQPKGWLLQGVAREDFVGLRDASEKHGGNASAKLVNKIDMPRGHAALAQSIAADEWAGMRVRVSAWVKSRALERGGSFSVTTFAADSVMFSPGLTRAYCPLDFDMVWRRCEGVLDIPRNADSIQVALNLQGKGEAWIDDLEIVPVGLDVPPTNVDQRPRAIENGDLEAPGKSPPGWSLQGGARAHYVAVVDTQEKHGGRSSARLEPRVKDPNGYGTLMQQFRVDHLRGKRMRMTAFVKGKDIDGRGDLWLRVQAADSPGDGPGLGGGSCKLSGTFDWKPCTIVFDIPERGDGLDIGIGLDPHGTLWIDDVTFEEVDRTVPVTRPRFARLKLEDGSFEGMQDAPNSWSLSGAGKKDFRVAIDTSEHAEGKASLRFEPTSERPSGYGTVMTSVLAEPYRGKRMRLSAKVKGRGIAARGDLWLRVQAQLSPSDGPGLGGGTCKLTGDFDWRPCTIVFDVPDRGVRIETGIGLGGRGTVWLDDVKLEEVERTTKVTGVVRERSLPENLGFEIGLEAANRSTTRGSGGDQNF